MLLRCARTYHWEMKRNLRTNIYVDSYISFVACAVCALLSCILPFHGISFPRVSSIMDISFFSFAISHFTILISKVFALLTFNLFFCFVCALFLSFIRGLLSAHNNAFHASFCSFSSPIPSPFGFYFERLGVFFHFTRTEVGSSKMDVKTVKRQGRWKEWSEMYEYCYLKMKFYI